MRIYCRKRKDSNSKSWYIDYRDPITRKRIRKICGKTGDEAELFRANLIIQLQRRGTAPLEPTNPLFYDFIQEYIDHRAATGISNSSLRRYKEILQNFVDFTYKEKSHIQLLSDVSVKDLWDYIHYRKKLGIADKTLSNELDEIKRCFKYAIEINAVQINPCQNVKFKIQHTNAPHFFTKDELTQIFDSFQKEWMKDIFKVYLYTGMRKGELMHLQWKYIDMENRLIHIRHQVIKDGQVIYKTKTRSSARSLPMTDEVYNILKRQKKRNLHKDYVFVNGSSVPFRDDDLYHYLKPRLVKLEIKGSIHTFRHTFASLLIEADVGLRELKELMGHSNIDTTMQYAHLYPHRLHEQVNRLNGLLLTP
ncbi:site-specific integrase [bacterium]|nr:site-specific integrase [bacterium]